MIAFDAVCALIQAHVHPLSSESSPVHHATQRVVAQAIQGTLALPPFAQSAMDGFAVAAASIGCASFKHPVRLRITGALFAGMDNRDHVISDTGAYRISTGAMLPAGADAVVRQEDVTVDGDVLVVTQPVASGRDVRAIGEWLPTSYDVAEQGQRLSPSMAAIAAMLGLDRVHVYKKPRVGLITCGDEIIEPGQSRQPWQVYNGNTTLLTHLLNARGITSIEHVHLPDDHQHTATQARALAERVDVILTTGGASVGARDMLRKLSRETTPLFEKVAQRPGKPTFLTHLDGTLWLGLPGPPLAAYTNAVTHLFDVLDCLEGTTPQPWHKSDALPEQWGTPHPTMTRLILACHDAQTGHLSRASDNLYEAMILANAIVALPPELSSQRASWRLI